VWALNSSNVKFYQNTFINSTACISRDGRSAQGDHFGWHPSTGPDIDNRNGHIFVNNLLYGDRSFQRPLLFIWQNPVVCDRIKTPELTRLDNNIFIDDRYVDTIPLILWSPVDNAACQIELNSPSDITRLYPQFSIHSQYFRNAHETVFKSPELGNYQVLKSFQGVTSAAELPAEIKKLLKISRKVAPYIGAYQPVE
jgi:hypothetical protein